MGRTLRCSLQDAYEKGVASEVLDGIKVVLAQTQQAQITLDDVTIGDHGVHRENRIDRGIDIDAFEILAHQDQFGVGTKIVE